MLLQIPLTLYQLNVLEPCCPTQRAGYAAQSLLAALGCIQIVSNVIFARIVLKEPLSSGILIATAFIVVGCVFLIVFGSHASHVYTSQDLISLYGR